MHPFSHLLQKAFLLIGLLMIFGALGRSVHNAPYQIAAMLMHPDTLLMHPAAMPMHLHTLLMHLAAMPMHTHTLLMHPTAFKKRRF